MIDKRKLPDPYGIGPSIRRRRLALGLTQRELARRSGDFVPMDVHRWETGVAVPRTTSLVAIAKALGCTLTELTGH